MITGNTIVLNIHIRKEEIKGQSKPKQSRQEKLRKVRVKIHEIEKNIYKTENFCI